MRVSEDGQVVDFGYLGSAGPVLRFDVRSMTLTKAPATDDTTSPSRREGLMLEGWRDGASPSLDGRVLPFESHDRAHSLAIHPDTKRFFIGSSYFLTAFDDTGSRRWRRPTRATVWAVNASKNGRIVVAAYGDGTIRWHRADDGRELLALQVLPNSKERAQYDWVLWTPEGFFEATPGAEDVLRWVVNHGPEKAPTSLPVSAIAKLHRPDALRLVLQELGSLPSIGVTDVAAARLAVQAASGSAKPPGPVLRVLAIGVDQFGDKAGELHLDYAAEDARDFASALLESQKSAPGKASLYADVSVLYLTNDQASRTAILDALDVTAHAMQTDGDVAMILFSNFTAPRLMGNSISYLMALTSARRPR